jgi:hypothetical protein
MARISSFNTAAFFFWGAKFCQLVTQKTQCDLQEGIKKKNFQKFTIFLRKKKKKRKNLPDLDSESV